MKKILIVLLGLFSISFAQNKKINNTEKLYNEAIAAIGNANFNEAINKLKNCLLIDSNYLAAQLSLAGVYGELKQYQLAANTYKLVLDKDYEQAKYYLLPYSINLAGVGKFKEALEAVNNFLQISTISEKGRMAAAYRKKCYEFAVENSKQNSNYVFNPINLGDSINTPQSEYYPSLAVADTLLLFTRRTEKLREDFFKSSQTKNNIFSQANIINGSINEHPFKGAVTVSTDGEYLIYAADYGNKGYGNFDLYIAYKTKEGWSEPENMGNAINTEFWESSPSLSPDGRVLYFSSNRNGGLGGKDLYISIKQKNGKWGKPINMGKNINTQGDELYPYIHPDNQTLYFASNGLLGYGNTDLFICRRNINGEWDTPKNLGYPINTIDEEGSITVDSKGLYAYYASNRYDSKGGLDIYKFELPVSLKPIKTFYINGWVFDAETKKGIPCEVSLTTLNNNTLTQIKSDELGKFFIPLPSNQTYTLSVNRKGYLYNTKVLEAKQSVADSTYKIQMAMQPIKNNILKTFNNVLFANNSFILLPESTIELDKLVQTLNENSSINISIYGHTDNVGNAKANMLLSEKRAKAVMDYLLNKNILSSRLNYKGFGASKPIVSNSTEEGRQQNRRTEFKVTINN